MLILEFDAVECIYSGRQVLLKADSRHIPSFKNVTAILMKPVFPLSLFSLLCLYLADSRPRKCSLTKR